MRKLLHVIYRLLKLAWREKTKFFPRYPDTINFNITYKCTSHCVMCNMWRHKDERDFSIDELDIALRKRLFKKVSHVGLTGGEPSLREDFDSILNVLIHRLPSLKYLSIITNCINAEKSKILIDILVDKCKKNRLEYGIVLSMDGVGDVHDKNRGTQGNFRSLMEVVSHLKERNINFTAGCTITKVNVSSVYETYEFAKKNDISIYFSIAEYIDRLTNSNCQSIRSFSKDETYDLILFFHMLINDPSTSSFYKRSYWKNIEILSGRKRPLGCPYHNHGIVLSPELSIGHCAVHGNIVGSALSSNITFRFFSRWIADKVAVSAYCNDCFHYHYDTSFKEYKEEISFKVNRYLCRTSNVQIVKGLSRLCIVAPNRKYILVVGWYGTETVGDKAILGEIIRDFQQQGYNIVVASIYPFITERTIKELDVDVQVISCKPMELVRYAKFADKVVMGGGPLMDLDDLKYPFLSFEIAKLYSKETFIYGCGIGPLFDEHHILTVKSILGNSDVIKFRDGASAKLCREWFPDKHVDVIDDPATSYVRYRKGVIGDVERHNVLACFLRDLPENYLHGLDLFERKMKFEQHLADYITRFINDNAVEDVIFYSMSNFWVGGDDRSFARYFAERYLHDLPDNVKICIDNSLSTVDGIIEKMLSSRKIICMRFHSMLFAQELGLDYSVADYTGGGKISAYLEDHELSAHSLDIVI